MSDERFAERLKWAMARKRAGVRAFARMVSVTPAAVRKWLRSTLPRERLLAVCAQVLDVDPTWLAVGVGQPDRVTEDVRERRLVGVAELVWHRQQIDKATVRLRQEIEKLLEAESRLRDQGVEIFPNRDLQNIRKRVFVSAMNPAASLENILRRLLQISHQVGGQKALAARLRVTPQQLNNWLSGRRRPRGDRTLQLLSWVEAFEAKQEKGSEDAQTPSKPKTRERKSNRQK